MPSEKKDAPTAVKSYNRKICYRARKQVEDRLTKQYGGTPYARERAKSFMKGKHVHKTGRGLELIDPKIHGSRHGRGNKGVYRGYKRG